MDSSGIFRGCIPALMTPCGADGRPDHSALEATARSLVGAGMRAVVYCGSMGEWPLLTLEDRQKGIERLVSAGIPVIAGTGAQNPREAALHARHARECGAQGLMLIPRVLSRGTSPQAQRDHFAGLLQAGGGLPAVIYNSPYYGFETRADLFFDLRREFPSLVGFKEFGGAASLSYAAEHIAHQDPGLVLLVGVDTQVRHGFLNCGAAGAITGIGNVLPRPVLRLAELCRRAVREGGARDRILSRELSEALHTLSLFDEGPDLALYYRHLMAETGHEGYLRPIHPPDRLSPSQKEFATRQLRQFERWWEGWEGREG